MKNFKVLAMAVMVTFLVTSCTQRLLDFTVISSKNVTLKINKAIGKQTTGKSMMVLNIGVSVKDAVDDAIEKAGPGYDMLIDGVIRVANYPFYGGFKVTGVAVKSTDIKASMSEEDFSVFCQAHNAQLK